MPTFKAEVQRHHRRRDGSYPVSIRVTHNRKIARIPTGLYLTEKQINKKTFEIKDSFVIARTNITIQNYNERMLLLDTDELLAMPITAITGFLRGFCMQLDYLSYCSGLVALDGVKYARLKQVLVLIGEMGIKNMRPEDVNSQFIERFKEYIDKKEWKPGVKYKAKSKNGFLKSISSSFHLMCKEYNTDFVKLIKHTPTIVYYEEEETKKKTLDEKDLKAFLEYEPMNDAQRLVKDMCLLSFAFCGMNIKDLLTIKRSSYIEEYNAIDYRRSKTKIRTACAVPIQVQHIFDRYRKRNGELLFKFGRYTDDGRANKSIGNILHTISIKIGAKEDITPYWFRHTWASIARNKCGASKDDVDLCIAHRGNNKMADVYIKSDWEIVDRLSQAVQDYVYNK